MAKRGRPTNKITNKKRVRQKSPDPTCAGLGPDYFNSEIDWPVCKAEYESLTPDDQVRCLVCHDEGKGIIQVKVKKIIGISDNGGFIEAKCIMDGGLTRAALDLEGLRSRGVLHLCRGAAERCTATWGTRHVFHASKWRVMEPGEYVQDEGEMFSETGFTGVPRPAATIFGKDGDLPAGRAATHGSEDPDSGAPDPEMLRSKLAGLKASLGGSLPEPPAPPGQLGSAPPPQEPPKFPPDPPFLRPGPPTTRSGGRSGGNLNDLMFARAAERVQGATSSSSAPRPVSSGPPGLQGNGSGNGSPVATALNSLVAALQSADAGLAEPEAGGSVFREAPSRAVQDLDVYARTHPGGLLESSLAEMRKYVASREGAVDHNGNVKVLNYLQTVFCQRFPGDVVGLRTSREMRTLAEAVDTLLEGNLPRLGDILIQRFKALESSVVDGSWTLARHQELIPSADAGLAPVAERSLAARLEMQRQRLLEGSAKTKEKGGGGVNNNKH